MTVMDNTHLRQPLQTALWQKTLVMGTLAFWLSSTLLMDFVMMPVLYTSGMLQSPEFAPTGYAMFWVLNRVELICAAVVLVGVMAVRSLESWRTRISPRVVLLSALLCLIALVDTFGLSPQMSALGVSLGLFTPLAPPATMAALHMGYWFLDGLKLIAGAGILHGVYRAVRTA
jgi:Domain of unknown function (DUF4149)